MGVKNPENFADVLCTCPLAELVKYVDDEKKIKDKANHEENRSRAALLVLRCPIHYTRVNQMKDVLTNSHECMRNLEGSQQLSKVKGQRCRQG